ncbi:GNAT family N-acetyltransferase [Congregibacter sp.]|uniref:GNAT family N-acetyltransferase n=1 Tax=Congregibacter sp. TaxID=2744308 RepID=UPI00385B2AC7
MSLSIEVLSSVADVPATEWNALCRTDYPFLRHGFLLGLEQADCTTPAAGWTPAHLRLKDEQRTLAILPSWLKSHSYGEYVFDWAWADAWRRMGLEYYPKLVTAVPFTPATGPRLLHAQDLDPAVIWATLKQHMPELAVSLGASSWHVLFPQEQDANALAAAGLHTRHQVQFHWYNRGYSDFDDFLSTFSSRKRKSLRKERRRVEEQGLSLSMRNGTELSEEDWSVFHRFYQMTYAKRSGHGGYLTRDFFMETAAGMGDQVVMVLAYLGQQAVAGALYFRSSDTLYGRYWGCEREFDCLHFEACYYRGIEYCIEHGLRRFDPGAQGEHKIQRGFRPVQTWSNHWIADPQLSAAVGDFTRQEEAHIDQYISQAASLLPFKSLD